MKDYHVRRPGPGRNEVEAWSVQRLPFEPKGTAIRLRADLREALRELEPGAVCHAIYTSPVESRVDLENVLTYNLGTTQPFDRLGIERLILERSFATVPACDTRLVAPPSHHHLYRITTAAPQESSIWQEHRELLTWSGMAVPKKTATSSWLAFRKANRVPRTPPGDVMDYFALRICLPHKAYPRLLPAVKTLVDGIIAGCGVHTGPERPAVIAALAADLAISPCVVASNLADGSGAVLWGTDLVRWRANRPHWNPEDGRVVSLDISLHDAAEECISGAFVTVRRRLAPQEAARRILLMVAELHRLGYERLRIAPGMSPSGMPWRCAVAPAAAFQTADTALLRTDVDVSQLALYTSADEDVSFGWGDAVTATPGELATLFVERFPRLAEASAGRDSAYSVWYRAMLDLTAPDGLPYAYADWPTDAASLAVVGLGQEVTVPLPPPPREAGTTVDN
jgi:hypothetical protein